MIMILKMSRWLLAVLAILIGLYPFIYFFVDRKFGLLQSKPEDVLTNVFWNIGFYTHISAGGVALLVGWIQFNERVRTSRLTLHRTIGKVYVFAALLSSSAAVYIALYAMGGIIASSGFMCLGGFWFYSTFKAYNSIKKKDI